MSDSAATTPKSDTPPDGAADRVTIAVVDPSDADAPAYAMFALGRLDKSGAFLEGSVFFERGEELSLELSGAGRDSVRVRARVLSCTPGCEATTTTTTTTTTETREPAGMDVEFCDLTSASKRALELLIGK